MKVLVVDDYPGAAESAAMLFELLGHECRVALTGTSGIEQYSEWKPDLVLLDIGLPDLSGYEVARQIRAMAGGACVFIAAMTGWASPDDRVKSLAAGIDMHVLKPPASDTFAKILVAAQARELSANVRAGRS